MLSLSLSLSLCSRDSVVSIETSLLTKRKEVRIPVVVRCYYFLQNVQTSWGPPRLPSNVCRGSFPVIKQPGDEVDQFVPSLRICGVTTPLLSVYIFMARPAAILSFNFDITHNTPHVLYKDKLDNIIYANNRSLLWGYTKHTNAFFDQKQSLGNEWAVCLLGGRKWLKIWRKQFHPLGNVSANETGRTCHRKGWLRYRYEAGLSNQNKHCCLFVNPATTIAPQPNNTRACPTVKNILSNAPQFRKQPCFSVSSQVSPVCPSCKSKIKMKMSVEEWKILTGENQSTRSKNLSQYRCPGIEPGPLQWNAGD